MVQYIIVGLIIAGSVFYLLKKYLFKAKAKKADGCAPSSNCGKCGGCG